jgi:cytochrome P450
MAALAEAPITIDSLPRASLPDVALGARAFFRPGAARSRLARLGERFTVDLPGLPPVVMTWSPEDAKAILTDRDGALSLGQMLHRWTPHPVLFGGDSLIFLEGEEHVRERRRMGPPFHGQMMTAYEESIAGLARERIERWPVGERVEFLALAKEYVLDVMRTIIFGVSDRGRMGRLDAAMLEYCAAVESNVFLGYGIAGVALRGRWPRYGPVDRAAAAVDAIVLEEIADRRATGKEGDFLAMLVDTTSDAILARDLRGLLLAGYETTAVTLASVVEQLAHHPDALERLHDELDAGGHQYTDAVIHEAMRLRPPFPFTGRRAVRDVELAGLRVRRGTMLAISVMAVHEREDVYPEPRAFRPERFLDQRPGSYTWLAFGGGPHRCIGASLALFESRILLRELLLRRTIERLPGRPKPPRQTHPMLVPSDGARVVLRVSHARG